MQTNTQIIEEIESLKKKAEQTRSIHSLIKDRLVLIDKTFLLYVTIGSAITAMLIFAPLPTNWVMAVGIFSASIFIASVIPSTLGFNLEILERSISVKIWGEWIRDAKSFCDFEIIEMSNVNANSRKKELLDAYKKCMENSLPIPDKKFNKYKQKHLQKVAVSKQLDKTPFRKIRQIQKDLTV